MSDQHRKNARRWKTAAQMMSHVAICQNRAACKHCADSWSAYFSALENCVESKLQDEMIIADLRETGLIA